MTQRFEVLLDHFEDLYRYAPLKLGFSTGFNEFAQVETDRLAFAIDTELPIRIERADGCGTSVESGTVTHLD